MFSGHTYTMGEYTLSRWAMVLKKWVWTGKPKSWYHYTKFKSSQNCQRQINIYVFAKSENESVVSLEFMLVPKSSMYAMLCKITIVKKLKSRWASFTVLREIGDLFSLSLSRQKIKLKITLLLYMKHRCNNNCTSKICAMAGWPDTDHYNTHPVFMQAKNLTFFFLGITTIILKTIISTFVFLLFHLFLLSDLLSRMGSISRRRKKIKRLCNIKIVKANKLNSKVFCVVPILT